MPFRNKFRTLRRRVKGRLTLMRSDARLIAESGLFDEAWYLARYPDVTRRGYPPLAHFIRFGASQGRDPNPFFNTEWYKARNPELAGTKVNPLVHYIRHAGAYPPSPGFDPVWYRAANKGLGDRDPLAHFMAVGRSEERAPRQPLGGFGEADPRDGRGKRWRIAIKIPAPSKSRNDWGEFHFAASLRRSFEQLGHFVVIDFRDGWYARPAIADDLVIVLRGALAYRPNQAHFNLLWHISHPELVTPMECEGYDLVCVASAPHAERLRQTVRAPVSVLLQATDPSLFHGLSLAERANAGIVFVGNSRGQYRPIVRAAVEAGLEPDIHGKGWRPFVPDRLIKGESVENHRLGALYSGARAVLNDHWASMREAGFISNRLFDVVASEGVAVSDAVEGIDEIFGGSVIQVTDWAELPRAVERATNITPETRSAAARNIIGHHSFDARARQLVADICALAGTADWKSHRGTRRS